MTDAKTAQSAVLTDLAAKIKAEHQEVVKATQGVVVHAIAAGEYLFRAKTSLVEHGEWLTWLKVHCELDVRTAQRYMRLAKNKDKPAAFSKNVRLDGFEFVKSLSVIGEG